jgi:hypothetical protein
MEPPLPLPMLRVRATVLTSFMNEDRTSLKNFRRFATPDEPNCLMCSVYDDARNLCHPVKIVRCCWMVVDASNVWDCILGRIALIPFPGHLTVVPSATFCTTGKR